MPKTHIVKQDEHLSGIAARYGFGDFHIIWDHPIELQAPGFELVWNKLTFTLHLAKGDLLFFAAHGAEFDPADGIMHSSFCNRVLVRVCLLTFFSAAQPPWLPGD
jgi:hypothetical protein